MSQSFVENVFTSKEKRAARGCLEAVKEILNAIYINFGLMFIVDNYDILMLPIVCFGKKRDKKEATLSSLIG